MDEPLAALDALTRERLQDEILRSGRLPGRRFSSSPTASSPTASRRPGTWVPGWGPSVPGRGVSS